MRYFEGVSEIALSEADVKIALIEFLQERFKYSPNFNLEILELKHCRSDSNYCLRFKIKQPSD